MKTHRRDAEGAERGTDRSASARSLYLVKRGKPSPLWKAPFHPVVLCTRRHTAKWEADWSGDGAWMWVKCGCAARDDAGWLLTRWNGLDIDYGHIVRGFLLPDGTRAGIDHDRQKPPWSLLRGAVWWSDQQMPSWLEVAGVVMPRDEFTILRIAEDAGTCLLPRAQQERIEQRRRVARGEA